MDDQEEAKRISELAFEIANDIKGVLQKYLLNPTYSHRMVTLAVLIAITYIYENLRRMSVGTIGIDPDEIRTEEGDLFTQEQDKTERRFKC